MNDLKYLFTKAKEQNPNMSLDELLYFVYNNIQKEEESFDYYRKLILDANNIDELNFYTKNVNNDLKQYVKNNIFPQYELNDQAHGIIHITEVIRRAFALNDTFKLNLDANIIYAIAACHDLGKYIDHKTHEKIAADMFYTDEYMKTFFNENERLIIKEAIEDHRSSKEDMPRSIYGKLISSADRNTKIDVVFIRSFFVAKERMPETNIEDYLNYTIERLSKKYSEENPENMFFEDETYKVFLSDMRTLLKQEDDFKNKYCKINNIVSRKNRVCDEKGDISYTRFYN